MSESTIRRKLAEQGYRLLSRKDAYGVKMYTIADSNNLIIAGEFTMSLDEVEKWLLESDKDNQ